MLLFRVQSQSLRAREFPRGGRGRGGGGWGQKAVQKRGNFPGGGSGFLRRFCGGSG